MTPATATKPARRPPGELKPVRTVPLVDPRVAQRGGTRTDPKRNYEFPGMSRDSNWRQSDVHKATAYYGCSLCGAQFSGPHAIYTHLAKRHDR